MEGRKERKRKLGFEGFKKIKVWNHPINKLGKTLTLHMFGIFLLVLVGV